MKKIAVFTSGGDSPGMNAHIRAVVRTGIQRGMQVVGIMNGYNGMIEANFINLGRKETANIIASGGTILRTSRSDAFMTPQGRQIAAENIRRENIDGIIACGGNGTFAGAHTFWIEHQIPIVGTPGTIDNDLYGTDYTIGYDTAVNTCTEAIDRIRDTAGSHGRVFIIEVMGRHAGFIAMDVGISCGAEFIAVPETVTNLEILHQIISGQGEYKRTIAIVGEGDELGNASTIAQLLKDNYQIDAKVTILGHIQRGGSPSVRDRVLASRLGVAAVDALLSGQSNVFVGEVNNKIAYTPLEEAYSKRKALPEFLVELSELLV